MISVSFGFVYLCTWDTNKTLHSSVLSLARLCLFLRTILKVCVIVKPSRRSRSMGCQTKKGEKDHDPRLDLNVVNVRIRFLKLCACVTKASKTRKEMNWGRNKIFGSSVMGWGEKGRRGEKKLSLELILELTWALITSCVIVTRVKVSHTPERDKATESVWSPVQLRIRFTLSESEWEMLVT